MEPLIIEPMLAEDWADVRRIYWEGIQTGHATFEQQLPEWDVWDEGHVKSCRLMGRSGGAALSPVSDRCVYAGVAEVSLYVSQPFRGRGVGRQLLQALIDASEAQGFWTLQSGIFPGSSPGSFRETPPAWTSIRSWAFGKWAAASGLAH